MKINCIIVEDEPLALERVKGFVLKLPFLHLLSAFDNALDALTFIRTHPVDLIFLDIRMDEFSGIQLLESAAISSEVIITTAYHEYALKGYDLKVTDYLLKPYTFERFVQAVDRAQGHLSKGITAPERPFIFVKTEYRLEKILLSDIWYIEGMRDYRRIHCTDKKVMTLQTFGELEKELPPGVICRVHKSFMVSLEKIESIERDRIRIMDQLLPISETYRDAFYELVHRR